MVTDVSYHVLRKEGSWNIQITRGK